MDRQPLDFSLCSEASGLQLWAAAPFPTKEVLGRKLQRPVLGEEKDLYRKSSIMQNYLLAPRVAPKGGAQKRPCNLSNLFSTTRGCAGGCITGLGLGSGKDASVRQVLGPRLSWAAAGTPEAARFLQADGTDVPSAASVFYRPGTGGIPG